MSETRITPIGTALPDGWSIVRLGKMCSKIGSGSTPRGGSAVYLDTGVSFIRSQNVFDHRFSESGLAFIDDEAADRLIGSQIQERDILLNITGDGETIARCCIVPSHVLPARVNQHVMIIRVNCHAIPEFLQRYLSHPSMRAHMLSYNSGGSRRALTKTLVEELEIGIPSIAIQQAISEILKALDDKIVINERISSTSRRLSVAIFDAAIAIKATPTSIESFTTYLNRGQAPKYTDNPDALIVLNQKCVRNGRANLDQARKTQATRVHTERRLIKWDVLVNSTGMGTLGRVGIWSHEEEATVDSHVTIVRIDPHVSHPLVGAFAMLAAQPVIEAMGEGSTGQTELSRTKLGCVELQLPAPPYESVADKLTALETRAHAALCESKTLAALRDTLLPELMSGRLRVRDAERIVEDAI